MGRVRRTDGERKEIRWKVIGNSMEGDRESNGKR